MQSTRRGAWPGLALSAGVPCHCHTLMGLGVWPWASKREKPRETLSPGLLSLGRCCSVTRGPGVEGLHGSGLSLQDQPLPQSHRISPVGPSTESGRRSAQSVRTFVATGNPFPRLSKASVCSAAWPPVQLVTAVPSAPLDVILHVLVVQMTGPGDC